MTDQALLARLLDQTNRIAKDAGDAILAISAEDIDARDKADGSPLTRADMAADKVIADALAPLEPKFPVLSEEGDLTAGGAGWETYWCVDPLDGTKEFVKGTGEYTVNIALVEDGKPVLGSIYLPATGAAYWAAAGMGAWRCDPGGQPRRISAVAKSAPASAVVSRSHLDEATEQFLARHSITDAIPRGSSLKICAVAEGTADVYPRFGPTCLWDTAAGTAIATEAGCVLVDLTGQPLTYDPADGIKQAGFIVHPVGMAINIG